VSPRTERILSLDQLEYGEIQRSRCDDWSVAWRCHQSERVEGEINTENPLKWSIPLKVFIGKIFDQI